MKIWVAYRDYGRQGLSEPLAAFSSEKERDLFVSCFALMQDIDPVLVKEFEVAPVSPPVAEAQQALIDVWGVCGVAGGAPDS